MCAPSLLSAVPRTTAKMLSLSAIAPLLQQACERELLEPVSEQLRASPLGRRFLNELLAIFEPEV